MKYLKEYKKPKFSIIKISVEKLLQDGGSGGEVGGTGDDFVKAQTFRIFDDSFDDLSIAEESDYTTTTNTLEVW